MNLIILLQDGKTIVSTGPKWDLVLSGTNVVLHRENQSIKVLAGYKTNDMAEMALQTIFELIQNNDEEALTIKMPKDIDYTGAN